MPGKSAGSPRFAALGAFLGQAIFKSREKRNFRGLLRAAADVTVSPGCVPAGTGQWQLSVDGCHGDSCGFPDFRASLGMQVSPEPAPRRVLLTRARPEGSRTGWGEEFRAALGIQDGEFRRFEVAALTDRDCRGDSRGCRWRGEGSLIPRQEAAGLERSRAVNEHRGCSSLSLHKRGRGDFVPVPGSIPGVGRAMEPLRLEKKKPKSSGPIFDQIQSWIKTESK